MEHYCQCPPLWEGIAFATRSHFKIAESARERWGIEGWSSEGVLTLVIATATFQQLSHSSSDPAAAASAAMRSFGLLNDARPQHGTTKLRFLMDARGTDGITNYVFRFGGTRMDPDDTAEMLGLQHGSMIYVGKIVSEGSGSGSSTTPAPLRDGPSCPCSRRLRSRFRPWARP